MKHIKLFEQFEEDWNLFGEEDEWWEKESPFDKPKLRIIKFLGKYYIMEGISLEDKIILFNNRETGLSSNGDFEYIDFRNFSEDNINILYEDGPGTNRVENIKIEDLPKEIKNRLI